MVEVTEAREEVARHSDQTDPSYPRFLLAKRAIATRQLRHAMDHYGQLFQHEIIDLAKVVCEVFHSQKLLKCCADVLTTSNTHHGLHAFILRCG